MRIICILCGEVKLQGQRNNRPCLMGGMHKWVSYPEGDTICKSCGKMFKKIIPQQTICNKRACFLKIK